MRDNFTLAHTFTARWEGGLYDHEADPGGITNHGISLRWVTDLARQAKERCLRDARQCDTCPRRTGPDCDYFSLDLDNDGDIDADDIRACTKEQAARLFRRHFWEALGCDRLPLPLAVTLYDGAINMGASRAVKQLQEAMNAAGETQLDHYSPIAEDGIMGPDTRELANALADVHLDWYAARSSLRLRDAFYRRLAASRPSMKVFLTGWRNRVKALHQHLADLEREAQ